MLGEAGNGYCSKSFRAKRLLSKRLWIQDQHGKDGFETNLVFTALPLTHESHKFEDDDVLALFFVVPAQHANGTVEF